MASPTVNREICLALALPAILCAVVGGMMLLPPPEFDAFGISLAERAPRFNESKASVEPVKWQNELQERCVKRVVQVARPQLGADQAWAYERWVMEGGPALIQDYLPGSVIDHSRNITTYQNLYRAMLDKCFYLQILARY